MSRRWAWHTSVERSGWWALPLAVRVRYAHADQYLCVGVNAGPWVWMLVGYGPEYLPF